MKPKKIIVTETAGTMFDEGRIYDVDDWCGDKPCVKLDNGYMVVNSAKWEPVPDFNHGDPVWAWDCLRGEAVKGAYIGKSTFGADFSHIVELGSAEIDRYRHVEHRKPTITLKEIAERADIDLDEYELVIEES